jgi:hypothetical protein
MHHGHVVGCERVREDRDLDVAPGQCLERFHARRTGDEVGRGDHDVALRRADAIHDVHLRAHRSRGFRRGRIHLVRHVGEGDRGAPHELERPGIEVAAQRPVSQHVGRRRRNRRHLLSVVDEMIELALQNEGVFRLEDDGLDGIGFLAVPVRVEDGAQSRHHAADDEHVHVDEIARRAAGEILVRDVASRPSPPRRRRR